MIYSSLDGQMHQPFLLLAIPNVLSATSYTNHIFSANNYTSHVCCTFSQEQLLAAYIIIHGYQFILVVTFNNIRLDCTYTRRCHILNTTKSLALVPAAEIKSCISLVIRFKCCQLSIPAVLVLVANCTACQIMFDINKIIYDSKM